MVKENKVMSNAEKRIAVQFGILIVCFFIGFTSNKIFGLACLPLVVFLCGIIGWNTRRIQDFIVKDENLNK